MGEGSLAEYIFDHLDLTPEMKQQIAQIIGRVLFSRKLLIRQLEVNKQVKKLYCYKTRFCRVRYDSGKRRQGVKLYGYSCKNKPHRKICQLTNLLFVQNYLTEDPSKLADLIGENATIYSYDFHSSTCSPEAVVWKYSLDGTLPSVEEFLDFCSNKMPAYKDAIMNGTIDNIEDYFTDKFGYRDTWDYVLHGYVRMKLSHIHVKPPPIKSYGAIIQWLYTKWYLDPRRFKLELEKEFNFDLSLFQGVEKDVLREFLGKESGITSFEELAFIMGAVPPISRQYEKQAAKYIYSQWTNFSEIGNISSDHRLKLSHLMTRIMSKPHVFDDYGMKLTSGILKTPDVKGDKKKNDNPFIPYCLWQGVPVGKDIGYETPVCNNFRPIITDKGFCYGFNNIEQSSILRESKPFYSTFTQLFDTESTNTIRKGSKGNSVLSFIYDSNKLEPNKNNRDGKFIQMPLPGKMLPVNTGTDLNDVLVSLSMQGNSPIMRVGPELTAVLVSKPSLSLADSEKYFYVYNIAVTATISENDEDTRVLSPETRGCLFDDEGSLDLFKTYSAGNCYLECKLKKAEAKCGCIPWNYPYFENSSLCTPLGNVCFDKSMDIISQEITMKECNCMPSCRNIKYDYELSSVDKFDIEAGMGLDLANIYIYTRNKTLSKPRTYEGLLKDYVMDKNNFIWDPVVSFFKFEGSQSYTSFVNYFKKRMIDDFVGVNIYFKSSTVFHIKKRNRVTLGNVLANIGGTLGLFMGISILSILEIIIFLVSWVSKSIGNNKKNKQVLNV